MKVTQPSLCFFLSFFVKNEVFKGFLGGWGWRRGGLGRGGELPPFLTLSVCVLVESAPHHRM